MDKSTYKIDDKVIGSTFKQSTNLPDIKEWLALE